MSTKYHYYSYLQTDYKKINLTAYSDKDINAWKWVQRVEFKVGATQSC